MVYLSASFSFPFPGGDRTSERKSGRAKEHACGLISLIEVGGRGVSCFSIVSHSLPVSFPSCMFFEMSATMVTQAASAFVTGGREKKNLSKVQGVVKSLYVQTFRIHSPIRDYNRIHCNNRVDYTRKDVIKEHGITSV